MHTLQIQRVSRFFYGLVLGVLGLGIQLGQAQTTPTSRYDTVAEMLAARIPASANTRISALVTGRLAANDGGGGTFFYSPSSATATNLGTVFKPNDSSGRWIRDYSGEVNVLWFGAAGNGSTDDTLALRNAISVAGNSGAILFPSGKTFIVSGELAFLSGQTVNGYGSTVKSADQVSSATSTAIPAGSSPVVVTVANGSSFTVGMDVTIFNGSSYDPANHRIISKTGNALTLGTAFSVAFPSGGTVVSSYCLLRTVNPNVKVYGLKLDGNSSNNTLLQKWQNQQSIWFEGDRSLIKDVYIVNSQAEGIVLGGADCVIDSCSIINSQGNGVHFSGSSAAKLVNCSVINANLGGVAVGHADGLVIFSNQTRDTFISGNYLENGIAGLGSFDTDDNSQFSFTGNVVTNVTYAFEGILPSTSVGKYSISGNQFYNAGVGTLNNTGSFSVTNLNYLFEINNNLFVNTVLDVRDIINFQISNNILTNSSTNVVLVNVQDARNGRIGNNVLSRGSYGVYVSAVNSTNTQNLIVSNNSFEDQFVNAVTIFNASMPNVTVQGNSIFAHTNLVSATYNAINLANRSVCVDNNIYMEMGRYGIYCPSGGSGVAGAFVTGNSVFGSITASVRCDGGSQNNIIQNNWVETAISDAGVNTVSGNSRVNENGLGSLFLSGNGARLMTMMRNQTADSDGHNLTIQAGGATTGGNNRFGGNLFVRSGIPTGNRGSSITFYTYGGTASGTSDAPEVQSLLLDRDGIATFYKYLKFPSTSGIYSSNTTPEGAVSAPVGSIYLRSDGGTSSTLYVKETGSGGNSGWRAVTTVGTLPVNIGVACSDETTPVTTGAGKVTFRSPSAFTLTGVRASLTTAQSSGSIFTVNIKQNGASVLSTKITIDNGATTSTTATTPPVISTSAITDDAQITVDVDQVGNGTATGLKVWLIGTR